MMLECRVRQVLLAAAPEAGGDMSVQEEGFLEFAKPATDRIPSFAELLHDRAAFTEEPDWLPEDFVYMGNDEWGQDAICGVSKSDFKTKPGYRLAWKIADMEAHSTSCIEYAAPHLTVHNYDIGPDYRATQTLRIRKDEWDHAFVFCVSSNFYKPSSMRHQPHVLRFTGPAVDPYRVVVKDQLSLDWVSAVPDLIMQDHGLHVCANHFIDYLQGYCSGRP